MASNSNTQQQDRQQTPTSQALAKIKAPGEAVIEEYRGSFAMVLPDHVKPDMFVRLSQGLLRRDRKLAQVANNNPGSFLSALLDCARLGLEPGDTYHMVPFGNEVTGIVDYKGELELIYRAGEVTSVKAELVHDADLFKYNPATMDRPVHEPANWFSGRGEIVGGYAYAEMRSGGTSRVVLMDMPMFMRHKAESKTGNQANGLWKKWPESAYLKTLVHELKKWVPSSAEYRLQVLQQEAAAQEAAVQMGVTLPPPDYSAPDIPEPLPSDPDDEVVDAELVDDDGNIYDPADPQRPM